jgi:hypothetical protein
MRADEPQTHQALIDAISHKLGLKQVREESISLHVSEVLPQIYLGDKQVWDAESAPQWKDVAPSLRVERFEKGDNNSKKVNFYLLDYWPSLVNLKCRYIVSSDSFLVGSSRISKYCASSIYADHRVKVHENLGAKPEIANGFAKTEIVEWGLADAVIATSGFRYVLRQAMREAIAQEFMDEPDSSSTASFAIISESLGSYVVLDAALNSPLTIRSAQRSANLTSYYTSAEGLAAAPRDLLCSADQWHLLANQIPLLRLSDLHYRDPSAATLSFNSLNELCGARDAPLAALGQREQPTSTQVVAYHEPNDLLTFYNDDSTRETDTGGFQYTDVISSYSTVYVPWLIANPAQAHTDQMSSRDVVEIMINGR